MVSNADQDYKKLVNVNKVAKAVKDIGRFAIYSQDQENNLLITDYFILNLTDEQAWEVQCKLLAKKRNVWLQITKEGLIETREQLTSAVELYFRSVNSEMLEIIGRTSLYLDNVELYAGEGKYIGVKRHYVEMLKEMPPIKKAPGSHLLIADDVHVLTPVKEVKCEYLAARLF